MREINITRVEYILLNFDNNHANKNVRRRDI